MEDVTFGAAFIAGIVSFISPCVLPLVPPYLTYVAGVTLDDLTDNMDSPAIFRRVMISALSFVVGFSIVFVAFGAAASAFGQALRSIDLQFVIFGQRFGLLSVLAGLVIIAMGFHFLGVYRIGLLDREARFQVRGKPSGIFGSVLLGMAFAFGWTPCIGPILGTVLSLATQEETVGRGAALLTFYSAGIAVPFLLAAAFAGPFIILLRRFRRHLGKVEKVMGGLLVITGVLFIFGQMTAFSNWILNNFPGLAEQTVL
jgi:cytochrome c-type biogenesis protein